MIHFQKTILGNGLTVIAHEDFTTQLAAVNVLYKVGARNEQKTHTGFAHLFEHLMFGGSVHIPDYDTPLQLAGGTNNAYTTNDLTNYYAVLPVSNIETALWLESDRMLQLDFSKRSLDVQRNVVCEEFKEHYINPPYGDLWHHIRKLVYTAHPYQWPTIGMELSHIRNATLQDVKDFFYSWYRPNNAVLVIAGAIKAEVAFALAEKWFGDIPPGKATEQQIPAEPEQTRARFADIRKDVPVNLLYKVYKMAGRTEEGFYAQNILSDVLGTGESSRLYQSLQVEKQLFTGVSAYISNSIDTGMFVISGKLAEGVSYESAEQGIAEEIEKITAANISDTELQRTKNIIETDIVVGYTSVLKKARALATAEMVEDAALINSELDKYRDVSAEDVRNAALHLLQPQRCSTLYYGPQTSK